MQKLIFINNINLVLSSKHYILANALCDIEFEYLFENRLLELKVNGK